MNIRRSLLIVFGTAPISIALGRAVTAAQQPMHAARIGYLGGLSRSDDAARVEALREGLRELGYVEGKHFALESRWAEGKPDRLPALAAELVRLKVDVIVTAGGLVTHAAKAATSSIPIVMTNDPDPVASGVIASLARPSGNVTGLSNFVPELAATYRLPVIYHQARFADDGGLMVYSVNLLDHTRRAATYVDKILRGAKPADLPVQQPMTFELVMNMKTAKLLGIKIPPEVMVRATRVIQ